MKPKTLDASAWQLAINCAVNSGGACWGGLLFASRPRETTWLVSRRMAIRERQRGGPGASRPFPARLPSRGLGSAALGIIW